MGLFHRSKLIRISFGVPYFDLTDARFTDLSVPVSVRGVLSFKVKNQKKFHRQYSRDYRGYDAFQTEMRQAVMRYVKECLTDIVAQGVPVVQIERKIGQICDIVKLNIAEKVKREFKLKISSVDITTIELDKTSEEYARLKAVTVDVTTALVQAETNAKIKDIYDKQRIRMEDYEAEVKQKRNGVSRKAVLGGFIAGALVVAIAVLIWILVK